MILAAYDANGNVGKATLVQDGEPLWRKLAQALAK